MVQAQLLEESYAKLGLKFVIDTTKHLYISHFENSYFYYEIGIYDSVDVIYKGTQTYSYCNLYEILLWYYYYTHKYRTFQRKDKRGKPVSMTKAYFKWIPHQYWSIEPIDGLAIVKEALDIIILKHNGIPKYYQKTVLEDFIKFKDV